MENDRESHSVLLAEAWIEASITGSRGGARRGEGDGSESEARRHNEAIVTDNSETKSTVEPLIVHVSLGGGSKIDWH